jgi:superfamily I DNA and/or RNA helicase
MRDLSESVFERLMRNAREKGWDDAYGMLDTQYRMHEGIAALIGPWYGDRLRIGHARQSEPGPGWRASATGGDGAWRDLLLSGRAVFVPSPRRNTPKYHEAEADRIAGLLRYMRTALGDAFTHDSIGVVTPWRTQISKIRERIGGDPSLEDVLVDTVERFQGSEKDHILVSFAVCHPGQMAILRTPGTFSHTGPDGRRQDIGIDRKLLVTLSRARRQVVVFGDEEVLATEAVWAAVIQRMTRYPLPPEG